MLTATEGIGRNTSLPPDQATSYGPHHRAPPARRSSRFAWVRVVVGGRSLCRKALSNPASMHEGSALPSRSILRLALKNRGGGTRPLTGEGGGGGGSACAPLALGTSTVSTASAGRLAGDSTWMSPRLDVRSSSSPHASLQASPPGRRRFDGVGGSAPRNASAAALAVLDDRPLVLRASAIVSASISDIAPRASMALHRAGYP